MKQILTALTVFALTILSPAFMLAQPTNPSFSAGANTDNLKTEYTPAIVPFGGDLWALYVNSSNGYLYASANTSSGTGVWSSAGAAVTTAVKPTTGVSATVYGSSIYVTFLSGSTIYIASSSDGSTWSLSAISTPYTYNTSYKPGLASFGEYLVLSFVRYGSPNYVYTARSIDGVDFSDYSLVDSTYATFSGPSLISYNSLLWITYTTTGNHYVYLNSSSDGVTWASPVEDTDLEIGDDSTFVVYNGALFFGGKSNYTEDNLWLSGTYNGTTFSTPTDYGQTLQQSPSLAVWNSLLYECAKSSSNNDVWCYYQ